MTNVVRGNDRQAVWQARCISRADNKGALGDHVAPPAPVPAPRLLGSRPSLHTCTHACSPLLSTNAILRFQYFLNLDVYLKESICRGTVSLIRFIILLSIAVTKQDWGISVCNLLSFYTYLLMTHHLWLHLFAKGHWPHHLLLWLWYCETRLNWCLYAVLGFPNRSSTSSGLR